MDTPKDPTRQSASTLTSERSTASLISEVEKHSPEESGDSDLLQTPEEAAEPVPPPWTEQITIRSIVAAAILVFLLCLLSQRTSLGAGSARTLLHTATLPTSVLRVCWPLAQAWDSLKMGFEPISDPQCRCHTSAVCTCWASGLLLHQNIHPAAPAHRHCDQAFHTPGEHGHPDMRCCWGSPGHQRRLWLLSAG